MKSQYACKPLGALFTCLFSLIKRAIIVLCVSYFLIVEHHNIIYQRIVNIIMSVGYKRNMMEKLSCKLNPGLSLLTDWIIISGNTALSIDLLISCLEQLNRDDIVEVIQKGKGNDF